MQNIYDKVSSKYQKVVVRSEGVFVYEGSVLLYINKQGRVKSMLNFRYWLLFTCLIIFGLLLGGIGVILVLGVFSLAVLKVRREREKALISYLKDAEGIKDNK